MTVTLYSILWSWNDAEGVSRFLWNRNQKSGFKSDNSDNSTPSGNATGGASKRVEEYLDGVKCNMLHQQGNNKLIIYQSCHAIVKQVNSHMINLALVLFENMNVIFMDITKCS
jgi:hypothetical protein